MSGPAPEPLDPVDLPRIARETMAAAKFPFVATIDGDRPRLRPVSPVRTDGFTVYVASLKSSGKTGQIEANANAELGYLAENHDQVRIEGVAEVLTDRSVLEEIWEANALLRKYLVTIDNPELIVYRVRPERVRFMREWALEYFEVPLEE